MTRYHFLLQVLIWLFKSLSNGKPVTLSNSLEHKCGGNLRRSVKWRVAYMRIQTRSL